MFVSFRIGVGEMMDAVALKQQMGGREGRNGFWSTYVRISYCIV
jgi:hypothetical protein